MSEYNSSSFPPIDPNKQQTQNTGPTAGSLQRTNGKSSVEDKDPKGLQPGRKNGEFVELKSLGSRTIAKPKQEELEAAEKISKLARKEGNKLRIGMAILGAAVAVISAVVAVFTGGVALIGLAAAALAVGIGVVAGNRRESGTQAAYAENMFQLEGNQTAAERFQDVKAFMKENSNSKNFFENLDARWEKDGSNNTGQPTAPTPQETQNARKNPESSMRGIPQQPASMPKSSPLAPKPEQKNTQPPAHGSQGILQRQGLPFNRSQIPGLSQPRPKSATMPRSSTNAKDEAIQHMTAGAESIQSGKASPEMTPLPQTGNTSQVDQIVQKSVNSIVNNLGKIISAIPGTPATPAKPATTEADEAAKSKPTKELSFEELTSKAETTEHNGIKFVNIDLLNINELSNIRSDGSNLPAGDRELFLACRAQKKNIKNSFKQYTSTYGQEGGVKDCMKAFKKSCENAGLSYDFDFQESVWEAAWASDIKDPKNPTEDEINAIHDTIKGHVECKDEHKLKEIIKSAIALRASFTQNEKTSYSSYDVGELAIQFQHPTLQLGKNSENILEGAVLYRFFTDNNKNPYTETITIKTDEKGELYFEGKSEHKNHYEKHSKPELQYYKKGTHGFERYKNALSKALQFKPAGDGENFVPLQEASPNIENALKIFENEAKKAADTTLSDIAETSMDATTPASTPVSTPTTSAKPSDTATTEADAAAKVADKGTTKIKSKFSNETLAKLDNIATFLEKGTADITEEEFVETLQFGSTEVRDVYTAAKGQGLLTKDLLSKLVDKQKECYKDSEFGSGSLTEQINTFKKACSEQGISNEAIDAVFKKVEELELDRNELILQETRKNTLFKLNEAGGIKGADGEVLISGDTLKTIFNEAADLRQAAIGNDMRQNQSGTVSLKELTDELEINTLILSEESNSAEGIDRLNGAILNITSGEGDSQQITLSVRDSKVFYKTTPDGEEKELDEVNKKHIQNALVFNETSSHADIINNIFEATPSTLETKQNLLGDIEKASTEPTEKKTGASEVADKSVDATEDASVFDELVSQAESITHRGRKFVSLDKLNIQKFEHIEPDGSNLPSGDREMFLAYKAQGKKLGNIEEFFEYCTFMYGYSVENGGDFNGVGKYIGDFQNACKSAGISSPKDQENIWKAVWASYISNPNEPTNDEVNAILDTIVKGNVGCEDKDQLRAITKSAIAIKGRWAHMNFNGYADNIVGLFAIDCKCSTLKLGENSDNPIDGAILHIGNDKDKKYIDDDGNAVPISIETDKDGEFYFKYSLKKKEYTIKEGDDEYETLKQALDDAFVFKPAGEEGDVMPLQEKLDVDEKLAIFTGKNKKTAAAASSETTEATMKPSDVDDDKIADDAVDVGDDKGKIDNDGDGEETGGDSKVNNDDKIGSGDVYDDSKIGADDKKIDDTSAGRNKATKPADESAKAAAPAPAEPLDPVAAAAAKVNITIQKSDDHWEYQNIHPLQPEDISNIKNFERKIGDPNTPASITILLKKGIERQEENIKENAEKLGWDISKFNISDSQKLEAAKYLQGRYYKKVDQAKMEFEDACAKIGFTTDGQKNFMCQMMQAQLSPSSASKLYNNLSKQIGFKEMNQEDLKKACEAVESLHRIVAHSDSASSEDLKGLSTIIGPIVSMRPVYSERNLEKFEVNVFANGNHLQNCKIEYKTKTGSGSGIFNRDPDTYDIPTGVSYIDPTTKEEKKYELYTVLQITQGPEGSDRFDLWCNDTARK